MTGPPKRQGVTWATCLVLGLVIGPLTVGGSSGIAAGMGMGLALAIALTSTQGRNSDRS